MVTSTSASVTTNMMATLTSLLISKLDQVCLNLKLFGISNGGINNDVDDACQKLTTLYSFCHCSFEHLISNYNANLTAPPLAYGLDLDDILSL